MCDKFIKICNDLHILASGPKDGRRDSITVNAKLIIQYVRKGESYNTKGGISGSILFNRA